MNGRMHDEPFVADLDDPRDRAEYELADVLLAGRSRPPGAAAPLTRWVLRRYPGCLVAVARCGDGRCVVATRTGLRLSVAWPGERGCVEAELAQFAALVFTWLMSSRPGPGEVRATAR